MNNAMLPTAYVTVWDRLMNLAASNTIGGQGQTSGDPNQQNQLGIGQQLSTGQSTQQHAQSILQQQHIQQQAQLLQQQAVQFQGQQVEMQNQQDQHSSFPLMLQIHQLQQQPGHQQQQQDQLQLQQQQQSMQTNNMHATTVAQLIQQSQQQPTAHNQPGQQHITVVSAGIQPNQQHQQQQLQMPAPTSAAKPVKKKVNRRKKVPQEIQQSAASLNGNVLHQQVHQSQPAVQFSTTPIGYAQQAQAVVSSTNRPMYTVQQPQYNGRLPVNLTASTINFPQQQQQTIRVNANGHQQQHQQTINNMQQQQQQQLQQLQPPKKTAQQELDESVPDARLTGNKGDQASLTGDFSCPICAFACKEWAKFQEHQDRCRSQYPYACRVDGCERAFSAERGRNIHEWSIHKLKHEKVNKSGKRVVKPKPEPIVHQTPSPSAQLSMDLLKVHVEPAAHAAVLAAATAAAQAHRQAQQHQQLLQQPQHQQHIQQQQQPQIQIAIQPSSSIQDRNEFDNFYDQSNDAKRRKMRINNKDEKAFVCNQDGCGQCFDTVGDLQWHLTIIHLRDNSGTAGGWPLS